MIQQPGSICVLFSNQYVTKEDEIASICCWCSKTARHDDSGGRTQNRDSDYEFFFSTFVTFKEISFGKRTSDLEWVYIVYDISPTTFPSTYAQFHKLNQLYRGLLDPIFYSHVPCVYSFRISLIRKSCGPSDPERLKCFSYLLLCSITIISSESSVWSFAANSMFSNIVWTHQLFFRAFFIIVAISRRLCWIFY